MVNELFILSVCISFWLLAKQVKVRKRRKLHDFQEAMIKFALACGTAVQAVKGLGKALNNIHYLLGKHKGFDHAERK